MTFLEGPLVSFWSDGFHLFVVANIGYSIG